MSFRKTARVQSYGAVTFDSSGGLQKTAKAAGSYYLDGSRKISVKDLLERVASDYAISPDPRDYVFEAIRANTTNTPNENDDGFHKSELLRFDTKLGMPVYLTYSGKPHHVNHKCFVEGTPVVMADGTTKPVERVAVGDKVLDRTGKQQTVTAAWNEGIPPTLTKIAVKGYGEFLCTSHHNFPVWAWPRLCGCGCGNEVKPGRAYLVGHYKGGRTKTALKNVDGSTKRNGGVRRVPEDYQPYHRLEAGQIRRGDYLYIPTQRPNQSTAEAPSLDKARLLGYYVAEGCSSYKGTRWSFGSHEQETWAADVERVCNALGVTTRKDLNLERGSCVVRTIGVASHDLQNWLRAHGGHYAHEKRLSQDVMCWPLSAKQELLRGLFRGDGSQHYRNLRTRSGRFYRQFIVAFTTVSAALASQVRLLLTELGFPTALESSAPGANPKYIIRAHSHFARDLARLVWAEAALGQEITDSTAANTVRRDGDFLLVPVRSVRTVANSRSVYNLTVSGDHSYLIGGGLATFNTENPKAARGVIIDSHYNDDHTPLASCPRCAFDTSRDQNRDSSGIHCANCGQVVRDEFVEILVGVDSKKDPTFAAGVASGQLNAGSMGCNCASTTCNVCGHVAFSRPEFCQHIRSGSKGTLWKKQGDLWMRTNAVEVEREMRRARMKFDPTDFCYVDNGLGFVARKAFEYCNQVIFDEYSRVDQPADPKALQREVLKQAGAESGPGTRVFGGLHVPGHQPTAEELRSETEDLMRAASQKKQASSDATRKTAKKYTVIRVAGDPNDIHAAETLDEAMDVAGLSPDDEFGVEVCEVEAASPAEAVSLFDESACQPLDMMRQSDVVIEAPPDESVVVKPPSLESMGEEPPASPPAGEQPADIQQFVEDEEDTPGVPGAPESPEGMTPEELGMRPTASQQRFASSYASWFADVSQSGNVTVSDGSGAPVLLVRAAKQGMSESERRAYGTRILQSVLDQGAVRTAQEFKALIPGKTAQIVDNAVDDMREFADKYMHDSVLDDGGENADDMQHSFGPPPSSTLDKPERDMQVESKPKWKSTQDDGHVDSRDGYPKGPGSVLDDQGSDMGMTRKRPQVGKDSLLDNEEHDHKAKMAALKVAHLTAVGTRIASKAAPEDVWTVREATLTPSGVTVLAARKGRVTKQLTTQDLLADWRPVDKVASSGGEEVIEKQRKAYVAKTAELAKQHEAALAQAKKEAVKSFCRALRLAARRQEAALEEAPLRRVAEKILSTPRVLARDAATQTQVEFPGMDAELARHLTGHVLAEGHGEHLEALMMRAAALMQKGDSYLADAEKDAAAFKPSIPPVTAAVGPRDVEAVQADTLRQAALHGNLAFSPTPAVDGTQDFEDQKRASIREALRGTRVAGLHSNLV